jgi:polyisoprenoid-binding protein YceI
MQGTLRNILAFGLIACATGCANPGKDKPQAKVGEAAAPAQQAPAAITEQVALTPENTTLGFVGSKVTGSHDGGFKAFTGAVGLGSTGPTASKVALEIDVSSLWSDNDNLTKHLLSPDFFDAAVHPKATFASTSIQPAAAGGSNYTITGNLNLHGVEKSISFPATIDVTAGEVMANAEFVINRKDFGIVYPGKPDDLIRDEVVLKLAVKAPRAAAHG